MENKGSFIFDIDGNICVIKKKDEEYMDLIPYENIVKKIRSLKEDGYKIILFTSRNMNSYSGNLGLINKNTAKVMLNWLDKWDIPYDEIIYGKPWPGRFGFYVDDRAVRPKELLENSVEDLTKICDEDRL